jgi:hypothetical protein
MISGKRKNSVGSAITASSKPVYDGWGPGAYWGCAEWMLWHQQQVKAYGQQTANQNFIQAWGAQDSFMGPYNWCKYNAEFANYFAKQGIETGWLLSNLITGAQTVGTNVVTTATNVSSGVATTSNMVKYLLPFAAIGAGVWAFDKYVKKIF